MEIGAITFLIIIKFKVLRNNNFIENNSNCYKTSILYKSGNNFSSVEENIENYKNKLLSSYWTEINLIGYKIELLEKQKVEYPKELKTKIIEIGNKISKSYSTWTSQYIFFIIIGGNIEGNKRNCFNCGVKNVSLWDKYLKEHYLCHVCYNYKRRYAKFRSEEMWFKTFKVIFSIFFIFSKLIER